MKNMTKMMNSNDINQLQNQGCFATDWNCVEIAAGSDLSLIRNVDFSGKVTIGKVTRDAGPLAGIRNAVIADCSIGDNPSIRNVLGILQGARIGNNVTISNVGRYIAEAEAVCGVGTAVSVLDETGSRPVYIYPGLNAQMAALMTLHPAWVEDTLLPMLQEHWDDNLYQKDIEDNAKILDAKTIINVHVGAEVTIQGASHLENGSIINNAPAGKCLAFIGSDVDAVGFIVEDGVVDSGTLLRNVYVGQGAMLEKGFTAHDSLFFANCSMENGEACALFAGPYTVSMHKSSLLIATQTSFMNAGSGTNFSNHMYKMGPVHWGLMERGVKTASNSYMMWGGRLGAFSMLMGNHKTHPNTSPFPFSYLFGTEKGETIVAPGQMIKSCGLVRDAQKWPVRDRRIKRRLPLHDNINFDVLNPYTVGMLIHGLKLLEEIEEYIPDEDGLIRTQGVALRPSAIQSGKHLYMIAILRYLYEKSHVEGFAEVTESPEMPYFTEWVDLAGGVVPRFIISYILEAESLEEIHGILHDAFADFDTMEKQWIRALIESGWKSLLPEGPRAIVELDTLLEEDRAKYKASLAREITTTTR
jgi:hypothetical protein